MSFCKLLAAHNCSTMSRLCSCIKSVTMNSAKKVNFDDKVTVFYFKQAPIDTTVNWQQVARDRMRFKRRILNVDKEIKSVFKKNHRERIFMERFYDQ